MGKANIQSPIRTEEFVSVEISPIPKGSCPLFVNEGVLYFIQNDELRQKKLENGQSVQDKESVLITKLDEDFQNLLSVIVCDGKLQLLSIEKRLLCYDLSEKKHIIISGGDGITSIKTEGEGTDYIL